MESVLFERFRGTKGVEGGMETGTSRETGVTRQGWGRFGGMEEYTVEVAMEEKVGRHGTRGRTISLIE